MKNEKCSARCKNCPAWPSKTMTRMVKITKVRKEFDGNVTFFMDEELEFEPGQFAMVWLPGFDEKPIALIPWGKKYALNIEAKGTATTAMTKLKAAQSLGVRGPYGKAFTIEGIKNAAIVAGGVGIDSVVLLAQKLSENGCKSEIILGARTKSRIVFEKELSKFGNMRIATDDGSYGEKGYNVQILGRLLGEGKKFDMIYACGPEIMMVKAFEIAKKYKANFECSVERYMKCGIGICGECVINDKLTCVDGPVFNSKELSGMSEFGKVAYLKSGRRVGLEEYYKWREP